MLYLVSIVITTKFFPGRHSLLPRTNIVFTLKAAIFGVQLDCNKIKCETFLGNFIDFDLVFLSHRTFNNPCFLGIHQELWRCNRKNHCLPQAAKFSESLMGEATVRVGQNGTRVAFADWDIAPDTEDNSTVIVAVTDLGIFASEGNIVDSDI